jgi:hypothetical protein
MKHIKEPNRSTLGRVSTLIIGSTVLPQIGMPDRVDSINRPPSVGIITVRASQHLWSKADSSDPQLDCRRSRQSRVFRLGIPNLRQLLLYRPFRGSADRSTRAARVTRIPSVADCGRVLSRRTAESQLPGGLVWGIGSALTEASEVDPRFGGFLNQQRRRVSDSCECGRAVFGG